MKDVKRRNSSVIRVSISVKQLKDLGPLVMQKDYNRYHKMMEKMRQEVSYILVLKDYKFLHSSLLITTLVIQHKDY